MAVFAAATMTLFFLIMYRGGGAGFLTTSKLDVDGTFSESSKFEEDRGDENIDEKIAFTYSEYFFDCDHEESLCTYFRPRSFFKQDGKSTVLQRADEDDPILKLSKTFGWNNPNLPALTELSAPSLPEKYSYFTSKWFTFVHIHKCGGTSVKATMSQLSKKISGGHITQYKYSFGGGSAKMKEKNQRIRMEYIEGLQTKHYGGIIFTVVRDPVERFISAVQQVMHYNDELRERCLISKSASRTIQCAVDDAREGNFRGDVHLLPMVSHFRLLDSLSSIAIFPMQALPNLLRHLGSQKHARDRTQESYATSNVLSTMSIKDCTADMLRAICDLYAVDVVFMKSMGFDTPHCA